MNGSQAQLEFLPERSTDFIFAVIGEEFGLLGQLLILTLYAVVIGRALYLAMQGQDTFARLTGGAIALSFFVYVFVNSGMVSGILPVVGVPLPLISYGGTSMVTLLAGLRHPDVAPLSPQVDRLVTVRPLARRSIALLAAVLWLAGSQPAAALNTHRADVKAFVAEMADQYGFKKRVVRKWLDAAQSQPAILEAMERPAEKAKPWYEYRPIFITERRIREGTEFWLAHRQELDRASVRSGVPPEILAAILGVETYYGRLTGSYRVLDALATLAFDYPPRSKFFKDELAQYLLLTRELHLDPLEREGLLCGRDGRAAVHAFELPPLRGRRGCGRSHRLVE